MFKTAPLFWSKKPGLCAWLLWPVSWVYALISNGVYWYRSRGAYRSSAKVICIGNVTLGGAGKTPVTEYLYQVLETSGHKVWGVSRGYGGQEQGPVIVDRALHHPMHVGDEPLMMAQLGLNICIAKDRRQGVQMIETQADYILLDDGFQNPYVTKDLSILVFDGVVGIGNGHLFPAGPLRERVMRAVSRADAAIIIGKDQTGLLSQLEPTLTCFKAAIIPDQTVIQAIQRQKVMAFAGIGRPEKFFEMLRSHKVDVQKSLSFGDHYVYKKQDCDLIKHYAEEMTVVTTAKDYVRLPADVQSCVTVVRIGLEFEKPDAFNAFLKQKGVF